MEKARLVLENERDTREFPDYFNAAAAGEAWEGELEGECGPSVEEECGDGDEVFSRVRA